jgi:hypothetical protein
MLTTLPTLKSRLSIPAADLTQDALLTAALKALTARFDNLTSRTLTRTENTTFEFSPTDTHLCPPAYPIDSVSAFHLKTSETTGWQQITPTPEFLISHSCIISLTTTLSALSPQPSVARVTYTGGYIMPDDPAYGTSPPAAQLPADLEQAVIEQIAYWFQNRDRLGLKTYWPSGAAYYQFAAMDLLDSVKSVLSRHTRFTL